MLRITAQPVPPTDPGKVYICGFAYGGMVGLYATALDERISGLACFSGFTPMRTDTDAKPTGGIRQYWEWHALIPKLGLYHQKESTIPYDYDDVLALIAGVIGTTWGMLEADRKAAEAKTNAEVAKANEELANKSAKEARANEEKAREAIVPKVGSTAPATGGRMARRSANIGLRDWVLNFGWLSISGMMWMRGCGDVVTRARMIKANGTHERTTRIATV